MSQALYRKYRSKNLAEIVGQDHITLTLKKAIKAGRINHAYLFTGPRGVGKTSIARILAHELNDLPYLDESIHLDIIEIDAASSRRIDEIRDLRDKVHISPTSAKYKVYIIDEVHMLTREAFNALLKTLEEPPAHCIFILATTEAHKLPQTIISRTQRFSFQPISKADLKTHLKQIAKAEKITIDEDALDLLAEHGDGSFRDGIGLLDQVSNLASKISSKEVLDLLGVPPTEATSELLNSYALGRQSEILSLLTDLRDQGYTAGIISKELSKLIRSNILNGKALPGSSELLKELLNVPTNPQPQELLEIILLSAKIATQIQENNPILGIDDTTKEIERKNNGTDQKTNQNTNQKSSKRRIGLGEQKNTKLGTPEGSVNEDFKLIQWPLLLEKTKQKAPALYRALRLAEPRLKNGKLTLAFQFALHQKKVNDATNKRQLYNLVTELNFKVEKVECIVDKSLKPVAVEVFKQPINSQEPTVGEDTVSTINNIFGSAEVLES